MPLLYESGLESYFERVVVVYVPRDVQKQRLMERDKLSETEAERRLEAQMPIEEKRRRADVVIDNSERWRRPDDRWTPSCARWRAVDAPFAFCDLLRSVPAG